MQDVVYPLPLTHYMPFLQLSLCYSSDEAGRDIWQGGISPRGYLEPDEFVDQSISTYEEHRATINPHRDHLYHRWLERCYFLVKRPSLLVTFYHYLAYCAQWCRRDGVDRSACSGGQAKLWPATCTPHFGQAEPPDDETPKQHVHPHAQSLSRSDSENNL